MKQLAKLNSFLLTCERIHPNIALTQTGVIAQLVERYNGIVEVSGSIPLGSTKLLCVCLIKSLSSRGLGHRPFTAVTGVRIPVGTPFSILKFLLKTLSSPSCLFFDCFLIAHLSILSKIASFSNSLNV